MTNYIEKGESINTVLADTVKGGDVVVLGDLVGVAVSDGDGVNLRAVAAVGVFELPKASGAISQGAAVYYDATAKNVTTTSPSNKACGFAWEAAGAGDETVKVKIG